MAKMGEMSPTGTKTSPQHRDLGLSDEDIQDLYAKMVLVRTLDERLWALNRQGRVPLVASCQGAEAASMASSWAALRDGDCFFFPYYRDMPLKFMAGISTKEIMISHYAKASDPTSGGRQFLLQGASLEHRFIHTSNVVGSSLTQATGYALGCKLLGESTVVLVYFGDGSTSEGEWHEAMNFVGIHHLPIIFLCMNNRLAVSVPKEKQMSVENVADRAVSYGFPGYVVDGTNALEVYQRTQEAIDRARDPNGGSTLLDMQVERLKPHTSDDDHRRYRSPQELEASLSRDPLPRLKTYLVDLGLLSQETDQRLLDQAKREVNEVTDAAENEPWPDPATLLDNLYAP